MSVHTVAAGMALLSFGSLCVFHGYLQAIGLGTYDWILSKRQPTSSNNNSGSTTTTRPGMSGGRPSP